MILSVNMDVIMRLFNIFRHCYVSLATQFYFLSQMMIQLRQERPDYTTSIYLKALTYQCDSKQIVARSYIRRAQNLNA
jgi:hypothetical protein